MTADFDPYQEWLGIGPHERPPDHYRLLGLQRFEGDPDVVQAAADQRMAYVRKYQTGPKSVYTQELLNQLAGAKLCLLDSHAKATYDAGLERLQAATRTTVPAGGGGLSPSTAGPHAAASVEHSSSAPEPEPVLQEDESVEPLFARTWFLMLVVGGTALIAGLAIGLGILIAKKKAMESSAEGQIDDGPLEEVVEPEPVVEEEPPVLVFPEAGGEINLPASTARVNGGMELVVRGGESAIVGWTSPECVAKWRFEVSEAGMYRVEFNYAVTADTSGVYTLEIDGERTSEDISMRGDLGEFKTDELFLSISRKGEHTLAVRTETTPQGTIELCWIRLSRRE